MSVWTSVTSIQPPNSSVNTYDKLFASWPTHITAIQGTVEGEAKSNYVRSRGSYLYYSTVRICDTLRTYTCLDTMVINTDRPDKTKAISLLQTRH
jgi:hypothetical protein